MPDDHILREPPHSLDAEQALLGGICLAEDWPERVGDLVSESDFFSTAHRTIFRHQRALAAEGKIVDVVTLHEAAKAAGDEDAIGGLPYLGQLVAQTPGITRLEDYARIVSEMATRREVLVFANDAMALAHGAQPVGEIAAELQRKAQVLGERGMSDGAGMVRLGDALPRIVDEIEHLYNADANQPKRSVSTGMPTLDALLPGDPTGKLIVLSARTMHGKTTLAVQIAVVTSTSGGVVAVFSLEQTIGEIGRKAIAYAGSVHSEALATGQLDADGWERLSNGLGKLHGLPLYIDDSTRLTVDRIRTRARRLQRTVGLDMVIVDYLQLLDGQGEARYEQVSAITRGLKLLANELRVPVIALSQVNRKCEDRTDKRPMLSDLRDSGSVEQDADVVLFVYRHEVYHPDDEDAKGRAEIAVAKNRNGRTGRVYATFVGEHSRFAPTSWRPVPPTRSSGRRGMDD